VEETKPNIEVAAPVAEIRKAREELKELKSLIVFTLKDCPPALKNDDRSGAS
jgi:hypothetical protein